jgi:hypothetical protein
MITHSYFKDIKYNQHLKDNLNEITTNLDDLIIDSFIGKTTNFDAISANDCYCSRCLDIDDYTYYKYVICDTYTNKKSEP